MPAATTQEDLLRLYRARVTVVEMLRDRGFTVATMPDESAETFAERVKDMKRDSVTMYASHAEGQSMMVCVCGCGLWAVGGDTAGGAVEC